jgi:ribonuclease VapC
MYGDTYTMAALDAFTRYGKGIHPAALNFGDCLTYAVAKVANEPLLCLGDDLAQTDLALA